MLRCLTGISLGTDPVPVVFGSGETSWVSNFTSGGGSEGDDSNLLPLLPSGSVLDIELHVQWTTRVSVACSLSSGGVNADDSGLDDSVDGVTFSVGDDGKILDHSQDGGDTSGVVGGFSPSGVGDELIGIGGVSGIGKTAGLDVVVEGDGRWELDQGNVVCKVIGAPLGMGPSVEGGDFNSVGLG